MSGLEEEIARLLHDNWSLSGDLASEKILFSTGPVDRNRLAPQVIVSEGAIYFDESSIGPMKRPLLYYEININLYAWRPKDAAGMIKAKREKASMLREALRILWEHRDRLKNAKFLLFTDPGPTGIDRPRVLRADDFSDKPPLLGYQIIIVAVGELQV